jgi:hypothetical protein
VSARHRSSLYNHNIYGHHLQNFITHVYRNHFGPIVNVDFRDRAKYPLASPR